MAQKLHVAFVWHMHQPLYKDRLTGRYLMPWVRLHAQKDYLDMVAILEGYPQLHQTFNLVPSLLEQLNDYAAGGAWDHPLELLVKPVENWSEEDKRQALLRFFDLQWTHMARPYPCYAELLDRREAIGIEAALAGFSAQDFADLVTWFNLAWFDPLWLQTEPELAALVKQGRDFSLTDRERLAAQCRAICGRVIPAYAEAARRGQIELTTTPYYHPILPLLCDTESARVARPELPLPARRYRHPEDARSQIQRGIRYFESRFGHAPRGMWPSEESVSPEALGLIAEAGLKWAISDEGVLARSLDLRISRDGRGLPSEAHALYQPYWVETPAGRVAMVFRDVVLSDLIGFGYQQSPGDQAAADLHRRLTQIRQVLPDGEPHLLTIALDGENCWEHYPQDGALFLHALYRRLADDPAIALVTVGEYLEAHPPRRTIAQLFSGSWIGADFTTWIGDPTKNLAWDALAQARDAVAAAEPGDPAAREAAWEEIAIAEGSDWFWWFGEGHDSGQDELFDWQFRLHLQNAYQLCGLAPPETLNHPIAPVRAAAARELGLGQAPSLDGELLPGEWDQAAVYDPTAGQGAMHAAAKGIARVQVGYSEGTLFLALTFAPQFAPGEGDEVAVYFCYPGLVRLNSSVNGAIAGTTGTASYQFAEALRVRFHPGLEAWLERAGEYGSWHASGVPVRTALGTGLEIALPIAALGVPAQQEVQFVVALTRGGQLEEILPPLQPLSFRLPGVEALA